MKKISVLLGLSFFSVIGLSCFANAQTQDAGNKQICDDLKQVAEVSMTARQHGASLETMLKGTKGDDYTKIAENAFERPIEKTRKGMTDAINNYADEVMNECYKKYNIQPSE